ncbi:15562_t:CDS:2, partial [Entrophospora sp. SA101]
ILLFTTVTNIRNLEQSCLWIMDGTFKTVLTLFRQLYTIHACVGGDENSRIMPLVYELMSSKSQECYKRLFQDLIDFSNEQDIHLQPRFILTDFEQAAINALCIKFPTQSVYRKIQATGLAIQYGTDENFSLVIRQIPVLAFLNPADIPAAFDRLKDEIPAEAVGVV